MTRIIQSLSTTLHRLVQDERGSLLSIEMILTATILFLGCIAGLATLRDSLVQELGDVSAGLAGLDHGYSFNEIDVTDAIGNVLYTFNITQSLYVDNSNYCEPAVPDPVDAPPMCINISAASTIDEGDPVPPPVP